MVVPGFGDVALYCGVDPESTFRVPLDGLQIKDFYVVEDYPVVAHASEDYQVVLDYVCRVTVTRGWWGSFGLELFPLKGISFPVEIYLPNIIYVSELILYYLSVLYSPPNIIISLP